MPHGALCHKKPYNESITTDINTNENIINIVNTHVVKPNKNIKKTKTAFYEKYYYLFNKYNMSLSDPSISIPYIVSQTARISKPQLCHFHIYDIDKIEEFDTYISNIEQLFNIIITYSVGTMPSKLRNITFLKILNKGYDIGGKICALEYINKNTIEYNYILFLHSKSELKMRKVFIDPLCKNMNRLTIIHNLMTYDDKLLAIFPDYIFKNELYESDINYYNEILDYLKIDNTDKVFAAGNCMVFKRKLVDRIFSNNLNIFYNILNSNTSFDLNWFMIKNNIKRDTSLNEVYKKFLINKIGNNLPLHGTSNSFPDGMVEHVFERIWINVIQHMKGHYLVLPISNLMDIYNIKINAIYLPLFHEIPENNKFYGEGCTEWTLLKISNDINHPVLKPHNDIGYYDLGNISTLLQQVKMASDYSINGFIIKHYWFGNSIGKVMYKPLEYFLSDDITFPFCISWANESWTRQVNDNSNDVMLLQTHNNHLEHIQYLIPFLKRPNYITSSNGEKIIYIYNTYSIPDYEEMMNIWKKQLETHNIKIKIIITYNSSIENSKLNYENDKFLFEPMYFARFNNPTYMEDHHEIRYKDIIRTYKTYFNNNINNTHLGLPLNWGNYVGRSKNFTKTINFNKTYLCELLLIQISLLISKYKNIYNIKNLPKLDNFININAWNEWNEQAVLEPNNITNYENLETIHNAIRDI
jgi:hypothetical protein